MYLVYLTPRTVLFNTPLFYRKIVKIMKWNKTIIAIKETPTGKIVVPISLVEKCLLILVVKVVNPYIGGQWKRTPYINGQWEIDTLTKLSPDR